MKNLILLIAICSVPFLNVSAQNETSNAKDQINWVSFEEAVQLNKTNPKKFFIDFYTDWCGWCKRLDAVTFKDADVIELLNDNYYSIKFDAERKDTVKFQNREYVFVKPPESRRGYHVLALALLNQKWSFPTMMIMSVESDSENVTFMQPIQGYIDGQALEPYLDYFSKDLHIKQVPFEEYRTTFNESKVETPE